MKINGKVKFEHGEQMRIVDESKRVICIFPYFSKYIEVGKYIADLINEGASAGWTANNVSCDICGYEWTGVYHSKSPKLECPSCGTMNYFVET